MGVIAIQHSHHCSELPVGLTENELMDEMFACAKVGGTGNSSDINYSPARPTFDPREGSPGFPERKKLAALNGGSNKELTWLFSCTLWRRQFPCSSAEQGQAVRKAVWTAGNTQLGSRGACLNRGYGNRGARATELHLSGLREWVRCLNVNTSCHFRYFLCQLPASLEEHWVSCMYCTKSTSPNRRL